MQAKRLLFPRKKTASETVLAEQHDGCDHTDRAQAHRGGGGLSRGRHQGPKEIQASRWHPGCYHTPGTSECFQEAEPGNWAGPRPPINGLPLFLGTTGSPYLQSRRYARRSRQGSDGVVAPVDLFCPQVPALRDSSICRGSDCGGLSQASLL